jgi:hypothetical protein
MSITFVPEKVVDTLSTLAGVSDDAFNILYDRLTKLPLTASQQNELINGVESISELGGGLNRELGKVLASLLGRMQSDYVKPQDFVGDLVEYLSHSRQDYFSKEALDRLEGQLTRLLSIETIQLGQNASSLQQEHERLFADARVVSDIRPVFSVDPDEPPSAAVIVHTLRIDYSSSNEPNGQYYFALDEDDLESLLKHLTRAKAKSKTLKSLLSKINFTEIA